MSTKDDITAFLTKELIVQMLGNYFTLANEATENHIINGFESLQVDDDKHGCNHFVVKIIMPTKKALLRNQPRVESNILSAIRELINQEKPHWKEVISKVEIVFN